MEYRAGGTSASESWRGEGAAREALAAGAEGGEAPEPVSIQKLTIYTCFLAAAAIAILLMLPAVQRDETERIVEASRLAQDGLERAMDAGLVSSAENRVFPAEELIVSPADGQRYSREIEIAPTAGDGAQTQITVTVGWETMSGGAHVTMRASIDAKDRERASAREALSP